MIFSHETFWLVEGITPRVMLIEDNKELAEIYAEAFKEVGCVLNIATDGNEGFRMVDEFAPDLIISDMAMPMVRGDEFLVELRRNGYNLPIIMVTGHGSEEVLARCLRANAFDFIHKPVNINVLLASAIKALQFEYGRQLQEALVQELAKQIATKENESVETVLVKFEEKSSETMKEGRSKMEREISDEEAQKV